MDKNEAISEIGEWLGDRLYVAINSSSPSVYEARYHDFTQFLGMMIRDDSVIQFQLREGCSEGRSAYSIKILRNERTCKYPSLLRKCFLESGFLLGATFEKQRELNTFASNHGSNPKRAVFSILDSGRIASIALERIELRHDLTLL